MRDLDAIVLGLIAQRRLSGEDQGDLLSMLLLAQDEEGSGGMTDRQVMRGIRIPHGLPVIFAGIRTAAEQIVSAATLAAFIGGGGLGVIVRRKPWSPLPLLA